MSTLHDNNIVQVPSFIVFTTSFRRIQSEDQYHANSKQYFHFVSAA